ncbi:MAG: WD40 repeat domain-containing protein [Bacteroidia bacterium]|jgi:WD40 repeat protein
MRKLSFLILLFTYVSGYAQQSEPITILPNHTGDLNCLALSDAGIIASAGSDRLINIYKADSTFAYLRTISGLIAPVHALRFSRDGRLLAAGCSDNSIHIYDSVFRQIKLFEGHTNKVNALLFDISRKYLFSGGDDGKVLMWEINTGKIVRTLEFGQPVYALAQTRNRQQLYISGADPKIKVFNLVSRKLEKTFEGHSDIVNEISISRDGKWMVSGSNDKTARVWELKTGKEIRKLGMGCWKVTSVAFSRDSKYIITGCNDGSLKMWDAENGNLITAIVLDGENFRSVALNRTASLIYAAPMLRGKSNYGIRVWPSKVNEYQNSLIEKQDTLSPAKAVDSLKTKPALINTKAPKRR